MEIGESVFEKYHGKLTRGLNFAPKISPNSNNTPLPLSRMQLINKKYHNKNIVI